MAKILIVEDDSNLSYLLEEYLSDYYIVYTASNGLDALEKFEKHTPDILLVDIMMPKMNGFEFIKEIRSWGVNPAVIFLTAKLDLNSKQAGFELGADDFLTKPVVFQELKWRIEAILRRARIAKDQEIKVGNFVMNQSTFEVTYLLEGKKIAIDLPSKEFQLLFKLLSYPNKIFSKEKLMSDIWGYDSLSEDSTIRTHFNRLRSKLEVVTEFEIINVRGIGYKVIIHE